MGQSGPNFGGRDVPPVRNVLTPVYILLFARGLKGKPLITITILKRTKLLVFPSAKTLGRGGDGVPPVPNGSTPIYAWFAVAGRQHRVRVSVRALSSCYSSNQYYTASVPVAASYAMLQPMNVHSYRPPSSMLSPQCYFCLSYTSRPQTKSRLFRQSSWLTEIWRCFR